MAFCTNQDVIDQTGTSLDTAIIDRLITRADNKIVEICADQGLGAPIAADVIDASIAFTSALVIRRHMVDGTLPEAYKAGNMSEKNNPAKVISLFEQDAREIMRLYVRDKVSSFRAFRIVGRDGERVGEFETMETSEEDET